jgi:hypothetical protein
MLWPMALITSWTGEEEVFGHEKPGESTIHIYENSRAKRNMRVFPCEACQVKFVTVVDFGSKPKFSDKWRETAFKTN